MSNSDWLSSGGAFTLIGIIWLGSAAFFGVGAIVLGNRAGAPNDGCLTGICNAVLALMGGGVGFLVMMHNYPYFILGSLAGAVSLPLTSTLFFRSRLKRGR